MINSHINKLVLSLSLHHARTLTSHHLNCPLNINLTIQSMAFDLVNNYVNDCKIKTKMVIIGKETFTVLAN